MNKVRSHPFEFAFIIVQSTLEITMEQVLPYIQADPRPRTHLPVALPLSFPSTTHQLNLITVLHLVHDTLSDPSNTSYFLSTGATPSDTALRGCMSLYLASDQDWSASNLLGAKGMGTLAPASVAEHFGIRTMVERPHESMPGIVVGEKDEAGQSVIAGLEEMFGDVAERLEGHFDCVGSAVRYIAEEAGKEGEGAVLFARRFCELVSSFRLCRVPSLTCRPFSSCPVQQIHMVRTSAVSFILPYRCVAHDRPTCSPAATPTRPLVAITLTRPVPPALRRVEECVAPTFATSATRSSRPRGACK